MGSTGTLSTSPGGTVSSSGPSVCAAAPGATSRLEYQAVLLAGGDGSRLYPLTEDIHKSLLPTANRALLGYQLQLLETIGIQGM